MRHGLLLATVLALLSAAGCSTRHDSPVAAAPYGEDPAGDPPPAAELRR